MDKKCDCKIHKENYTYVSNQPKNDVKIVLKPFEENYNYGYSYALYKPQDKSNNYKKWQGVL